MLETKNLALNPLESTLPTMQVVWPSVWNFNVLAVIIFIFLFLTSDYDKER